MEAIKVIEAPTKRHARDLVIAEARKDLEATGELNLRRVSRNTGLSSGAPYRHFQDTTRLEFELCSIGWQELKAAAVGGLPLMLRWLPNNVQLFHRMLNPRNSKAMLHRADQTHTPLGFDTMVRALIKHYWETYVTEGRPL